MFKFPKDLYTDVRIENIFETIVKFTLEDLDDMKVRTYKGAFIRIFDGKKWYYSAVSDMELIQHEIDTLAQVAHPFSEINNHPVVKKNQVHKGKFLKFEKHDISLISKEEKLNLLKSYFHVVKQEPSIKMWEAFYFDKRDVKEFYSSKNAELIFDSQRCGFNFSLNFAQEDKKFSERFFKAGNVFSQLKEPDEKFSAYISKCKAFLLNSKPVQPGQYTVILSPIAAGVFAHESFGHKSEADFMIGDEAMKKEWALGKKVGSDILSIVDDGNQMGSGYVPYDDEGTKAEQTYLIKNGILSGRLHSAVTSALLEEELTGNARAVSFEFEPIVRMTTTFIVPGDKTKEELFSQVKEGIFIETIKYGSGMSTFTMAPSLAYFIKNGQIAYPVNISVITGSVFETLGQINGLSDKLELLSFVSGGCGKMEQIPLFVGFGGPYVRIKNMNVQ